MPSTPSSTFTPLTKQDLEDPSLGLLNQQLKQLHDLLTLLYAGNPTLQGIPTAQRLLVNQTTPSQGNELVCQNWVRLNFVGK